MNRTFSLALQTCGVLVFSITALWTAPLGAAPLADTVTVTMDSATGSVVLGENFDIAVTVTNNGTSATPPLVVHLDITDPDQSTSVDPEDWTPTLSHSVGAIAPGQSTVVDWNLQPVAAGKYSAYAVVLASGVDTIASSNLLKVEVADQRSLNPGGILPVAIAAPTIIGGLLLLQWRSARRTRRPTTPALT